MMKGQIYMVKESEENKNHDYEEPPLEDFFRIEEVSERDIKRKKRKTLFLRYGTVLLAIAMLINGLAIWTNVINIPVIDFLKTSYRLSKLDSIQEAKKAVVTIEGENSKGTGFNIEENGLIITNSHVVANMKTIYIYFPNGEVFQGSVIKDNPEYDLAIVDITGTNLPVLSLQQELNWIENDHIYIIGNPLSYTQIANEGKIINSNNASSVLQITAPVYRGNSGSPVLTEKNEVIGVVYATTVPTIKSGEKATGLVVPVQRVFELLDEAE
jgi:serine protease Do